MRRAFLFVATILGLATSAAASGKEFVEGYRCKANGHERTIKVLAEPAGVPCVVSYNKVTEDPVSGPSEPWNADNDAGFCARRAQEFKEKHEQQWQWICERIASDSTSGASGEAGKPQDRVTPEFGRKLPSNPSADN